MSKPATAAKSTSATPAQTAAAKSTSATPAQATAAKSAAKKPETAATRSVAPAAATSSAAATSIAAKPATATQTTAAKTNDAAPKSLGTATTPSPIAKSSAATSKTAPAAVKAGVEAKSTATKPAAAVATASPSVAPVAPPKSAAPKTTADPKPVKSSDKPAAVTAPSTQPADTKSSANTTGTTEAKLATKAEPAVATSIAAAKTPVTDKPDSKATASTVATPAADPMPRATPSGPEAPEATVGTDAAFASTVPAETVLHTVRNISEVRHFFRTNDVPIFFIGATPFNLLGLDRWVRNFTYISYYDAWDGAHPRIFTPVHKPYREFGSGEEINNWLLLNAEVRARMTKDLRPGTRPKVAMVFFDEETEQICDELGYDLILPSAELRSRLDSKIVTTELGNEAGVASVPNVLTTGSDWKALRKAADEAGLGDELVVQTPYGDSGKTTFFINNEADWNKHSAEIVDEEIKIMRRINNLPVAVEAVLTRSGTLVGPFLTELAGHNDLTPYKGGWCGNEMHPDVLSDNQRAQATDLVKRMGDRLSKEGYRGFFEVDVLVDTDTDKVYLGELNPRISGASAITNVTAGAYADVPLFLFHLLEYMDVEFDLDIDEINARWEALSGADVWSQMIIKETSETVELLTATPATGQYYLDANGALVFSRPAMDWHMLQNESEAFFLRIYGPGDYRWKGADLGILVTKGRLQLERNGSPKLTIRAKHFIDSIRAGFAGIPVGGESAVDATAGIGVKTQW
ncbi:biotin carboxylase [Paeniglutamicibacter sulfureus]|uniref:ATP-grasp domain-containing protein n=1 Tax=Paeniglutamicibacter sulfureus TaxID=43666 RepID=A0ABU2BFN9_9MICC|nr:biotin carboxylase [Paeniglutamicibacter sulfureus]MDR7357420.1 hypothetical protein [Paeniglutamicibacter sulfureus]